MNNEEEEERNREEEEATVGTIRSLWEQMGKVFVHGKSLHLQ